MTSSCRQLDILFVLVSSFLLGTCSTKIKARLCPRGTFGLPDCTGICHCLTGSDYCRSEDGRCTDGKCAFGWTNPPTCQAACSYGSFGFNCSLFCHCPENDVCDSVSGLCSSNRCLLGWGGPSCQKLLPVMNDPPMVTATTATQITLNWPKWVPGVSGIGQGSVISHTLQQLDNTTNSWEDVVNLEDSAAFTKFSYTVVSLKPNTSYKYRILLVMDDSKKALPSIPGPESPNWIITSCAAPSDPPTDVSVEFLKNQKDYIKVSWKPPSLESMHCNGLARHEILFTCAKPCISLIATENWPSNVSLIEFFHNRNKSVNVTIRTINDAGLVGPLSEPFLIRVLPDVIKPADQNTTSSLITKSAETTMKPVDRIDTNTFITESAKSKMTAQEIDLVTTSSNITTADMSKSIISSSTTERNIVEFGPAVGVLNINPVPKPSVEIIVRDEHTVSLRISDPFVRSKMNLGNTEIKVKEHGKNKEPTFAMNFLQDGAFRISGLNEATQYTITVNVAIENTNCSIVLYTAPALPEDPVTPPVSDVTETSFKVFTRSSRKRAIGFPFMYAWLVIIEKTNGNKSDFMVKNTDRSAELFDNRVVNSQPDLLVNSDTAMKRNLTFYVTGICDKWKDYFVVGDGKLYGDMYHNDQLKPNSTYLVWFASQVALDGLHRRVISRPVGPVLTAYKLSVNHLVGVHESSDGLSTSAIILIVIGILLLILLVICLAVCLYKRRFKRNRAEQPKLELVVPPYGCPQQSSPVNRNLAVSYLNSFLIPRSAQKDFDAISGADGDFVIPEPCLVYESGSSCCRFCPVPVQRLRGFCSRYLLTECEYSLTEQFLLLPNSFTDSINVAMMSCNVILNRSPQVVPYDRNRVKLKCYSPQSVTYINASFVRTIGRRYCIVTQCPTLATMGQFWQMVWERGSTTIIMLMDTEAPDSANFDCYWPEVLGRSMSYENVRVELVNFSVFANYSVRQFKIGEINTSRERHVFHWQYVSWRKGGIPEHPIPFLSFIKRIREERKFDSGYVVHCRTGGGRSGLYVAIDTLLTQGHNTNVIDVLRLVTLLRTERSNLVKSTAQYRFIYECLCEEFDHNPTRFLAERFVMSYEGLELSECVQSALKHEQLVMARAPAYLSHQKKPVRRKIRTNSLEACRADLNSDDDNECDNHRDMDEDHDPYPIQAISGFLKRNKFIASQCPCVNFVDDFWHVVVDNGVMNVVMLNKMADLPGADCILPQAAHSVNSKHFSVICKSTKAHPNNVCIIHNLKVQLQHTGNKACSRNVRLFEFTKWPCNKEVPELYATIEFIELLRRMEQKCRACPIVFFSSCGSCKNRAALFIVLWYVIEQSEREGIVDIFSASRIIRSYLLNAVDHQDQYLFLYMAMRDYLKRCSAHYTLPVESDEWIGTSRRSESHLHWMSPSFRQSTSSSRRKRSSTAYDWSLKAGKGRSPKDPLRRNLYETDLRAFERKSHSKNVTDFPWPEEEKHQPADVLHLASGYVSPQGGTVLGTSNLEGNLHSPGALGKNNNMGKEQLSAEFKAVMKPVRDSSAILQDSVAKKYNKRKTESSEISGEGSEPSETEQKLDKGSLYATVKKEIPTNGSRGKQNNITVVGKASKNRKAKAVKDETVSGISDSAEA